MGRYARSVKVAKKFVIRKFPCAVRRREVSTKGIISAGVTDEKIEDFKDNKRIVKYQPELYTTTKKRKRE